MLKIWIVTHDGIYLDTFLTRELVMGSVEMTYQNVKMPYITRENEQEIVWDNGLKAIYVSVGDRINHL